MFEFLRVLVDVIFVLNYLFFFIIIFYERKNPSATWAWLMVTAFIPYFGFIIYLALGQEGKKHRIFFNKSRNDKHLFSKEYLESFGSSNLLQFKSNTGKDMIELTDMSRFTHMTYLNLKSGMGIFTKNNSLTLYHEGVSKFDDFLKDIYSAEKFIHIQYFIFRPDSLGNKILDALTEKSKQGVEVRLLVDGVGSKTLRKFHYSKLIKAGGKVSIFLPTFLNFMRLNFRNHRKIAIIDGNIGYIGGLNVGREYLGQNKRYGFWRDTHIRIVGNAVKQLELRFIMDWNFASKNKISLEEVYFPTCEDRQGINMQIVSSGPDTEYANIQYSYTKMFSDANEYIYIQTPYFIPDDSIFETLKIAALSGVDVRIIFPGNPDHAFVYWTSLSYLGELLKTGVKCYRYEKGFIHSKLVVVDGFVSSVGTANMDIRSLKLNFEINSFIYDANTSKEFEKKILMDIKNDCTEILLSDYESRSKISKIKESVFRLFAPLM